MKAFSGYESPLRSAQKSSCFNYAINKRQTRWIPFGILSGAVLCHVGAKSEDNEGRKFAWKWIVIVVNYSMFTSNWAEIDTLLSWL